MEGNCQGEQACPRAFWKRIESQITFFNVNLGFIDRTYLFTKNKFLYQILHLLRAGSRKGENIYKDGAEIVLDGQGPPAVVEAFLAQG